MIHEYTNEYHEDYAELKAMQRRCAKNTIVYPKVSWRK